MSVTTSGLPVDLDGVALGFDVGFINLSTNDVILNGLLMRFLSGEKSGYIRSRTSGIVHAEK